MTVLLQICAVIVTMALVAIAIVTLRAMNRFEKAAEQFSQTAVAVRESFEQLQVVTRDAGELVQSLQGVVPHVRRTASRFEALGERAAGVSAALLEQIETPVRNVVAVARGLRAGSARFFGRLGSRLTHSEAARGGSLHG